MLMWKKLRKILLFILAVIVVFVIIAGVLFWRWYSGMAAMTLEGRLEQTQAEIAKAEACGGFFYIYRASDGFSWQGAWSGLTEDTPYPITSITKMYTATVIMRLAEEGALTLDDPLSMYLEPDLLAGLHVLDNHDYSAEITIRHLLGHNTGLPDTTEGGKGAEYMGKIRDGEDVTYDLAEVLQHTKQLTPHFAPGDPKRAWYTDTNYQLLGVVIEKASGFLLAEAYDCYIFEPLGLQNTYLLTAPSWKVAPICHDGRYLQIPGVVVSEGAAGGIVSTAADSMVFIKAFFAGELFSKERLAEMQNWRDLQFYPVEYGMGLIHAIPPGPFKMAKYEIIGHTGFLGSMSYYCPARDLYITGTICDLDSKRALIAVYRMLVCFDFD